MKVTNTTDLIRYLTGFLLSLKLLLESFNITFISNEQIDAIVNIVSFLYLLYFGFKNNYLTKKGLQQKEILKKHGLD